MPTPSDPRPASDLPVVTPPAPVPVYDCHVVFEGPDKAGLLHGRVTNLPGLAASARSERELLTRLVAQFKSEVERYRGQGDTVPWMKPPQVLHDGERQRWIPVHL